MIEIKRNKIEKWLDKYNHIMELVRTLAAITILILQVFIFIKLFGLMG